MTGTVGLVPAVQQSVGNNTGECFRIDKDDACFSISASLGECFSFGGADDQRDPRPPDSIEIPGFSSVKCVQAHGQFEIVVVGMYDPDDGGGDRGVIARVGIVPSVLGGVADITGVEYYRNLDEYDGLDDTDQTIKLDINDVERLDGWDVTSQTSTICMVISDGSALWMDDPLLIEDARQPGAGADPFFEEDTFGAIEPVTEDKVPVTKQFYGVTFWQHPTITYCGINPDCSVLTCATVPHDYSVLAYLLYMKTTRQSDGTVYRTEIAARHGTQSFPSGCYAEGFVFNYTGEILIRKRKDFFVTYNAGTGQTKIHTFSDPPIARFLWWRTVNTRFDDRAGVYEGYIDAGGDAGGILHDDGIVATGITQSMTKISRNDGWFMLVDAGTAHFVSADGTRAATVTVDSDVTLHTYVAIVADGSGTLKQYVIEDLV